MTETLIIGAGLAGLAAARAALEAGQTVRLIEASDVIGGRVASDVVDGFILDRGFQVLLTSYQEARRVLSFEALGLHAFDAGALVRVGGRLRRAADPWRAPMSALDLSWLHVLTPGDAWRLTRLRRQALRAPGSGAPSPAPEISARAWLSELGFSDKALACFFTPFFGGVTLRRDLTLPAPVFLRLFGRFARGVAALPQTGMGAIPAQLAARLPPGALTLGRPAVSVRGRQVTFADGGTLEAERLILATGGRVARELLERGGDPAAARLDGLSSLSDERTTTLYFALEGQAPSALRGRSLILGGPGEEVVHHVAPLSGVCPAYAAPGQTLLSASTDGVADDGRGHREAVRETLGAWFGVDAGRLTHLRTDAIPAALPDMAMSDIELSGALGLGAARVVCGDDLGDRSIDGALRAGAEAVRLLSEALAQGEVAA